MYFSSSNTFFCRYEDDYEDDDADKEQTAAAAVAATTNRRTTRAYKWGSTECDQKLIKKKSIDRERNNVKNEMTCAKNI
jgi:hypothetical protein